MPFLVEPDASGLTFKELREEFLDRGFDDLGVDSAKVKRWVNAAYHELCEERPWPFLDGGSVEEEAPVEVDDLAHVLSVTSGERTLTYADERELIGYDASLSRTGSPLRWYRSGPSEIGVWPRDSSSILVRYMRLPDDLVADDDRLLVPARYQDIVIDGMTIRAYKNRDNFEAAQFVRQEWERGVGQMVRALLKPNYDSDPVVLRTGAVGDYL